MVAAQQSLLTVEIDGPHNENIAFDPIHRRVRGRWNWNRCDEPASRQLSAHYGDDIPGQRLAIDPKAGKGYLLEPLRSDEPHATLCREKLTSALGGLKLDPESTEYTGIHAPTWLFYLKALVDSGRARVVSGEYPADFGGPPIIEGITRATADPLVTLAAAIDRQTALFEKLLTTLVESRGSK